MKLHLSMSRKGNNYISKLRCTVIKFTYRAASRARSILIVVSTRTVHAPVPDVLIVALPAAITHLLRYSSSQMSIAQRTDRAVHYCALLLRQTLTIALEAPAHVGNATRSCPVSV